MLRKCSGCFRPAKQFFVTAIASIAISSMGLSTASAAQADANSLTIDIQIPNQLRYTNVMQQAEFLARSEITKQFNLNPALNEVQVVVLGHYVGDIVPLLIVNVSRDQWQSSPQVDRWGSYYSSTYALLRRHDVSDSYGSQLARVPGSVNTGASTNGLGSAADSRDVNAELQIREAFGSGLITRDEYNQAIDALD